MAEKNIQQLLDNQSKELKEEYLRQGKFKRKVDIEEFEALSRRVLLLEKKLRTA